MNFRITFLVSLIAGGFVGIISLIPFVTKFAVIILLTLISVPIILGLKKQNFLPVFNEKESLKAGALIGIFSTFGFGIIFCPMVYVMGLFLKLEYLGGFSLMVRLMSLPMMLMFMIFVCVISAIFNAFSALMYYYIEESVKKLK